MRYHLTPVRIIFKKSRNKFGKDVGKREPWCTVGEIINQCSLYSNSVENNQLLVSLIFSIIILFPISLISVLIFIISFLLLALGLNCSSFPSLLRQMLRLLVLDFSYFLMYVFNAINFPFSIFASTTANKFQ